MTVVLLRRSETKQQGMTCVTVNPTNSNRLAAKLPRRALG